LKLWKYVHAEVATHATAPSYTVVSFMVVVAMKWNWNKIVYIEVESMRFNVINDERKQINLVINLTLQPGN
jgi:hypothetical protein